MIKYPEVWNLEAIYAGGSQSPELLAAIEQVKERLATLQQAIVTFTTPEAVTDVASVAALIGDMTVIMRESRQVSAFIGCLEAQNTKDTEANKLRGTMTAISAQFQSLFTRFQQTLTSCTEDVWAELLATEQLAPFTFVLNEWRTNAKERLSADEEALIQSLGIDGYHGWGQMYDALISATTIEMTIDGETKTYSVGQANNLLGHKDASVRAEVFAKLEAAWTEKETLFAQTLNHLAGFRLQVYGKRNWTNILHEPLTYNRMKNETLTAMWGAITKQRDVFVQYLNRKAQLLGKEKLSWADLDAPVSEATTTMPYEEGAAYIVKQFSKFGEQLTTFTKTALQNGWIEAEDRPHKRPGGFCTHLPLSEQSRIFMTYSGTMSNVSTLAHEIGHAFHSYALKDTHPLNRAYAMNVAETASTFAEMIVADAAVKEATSEAEKLALLEDKIQRSVAFFMNIYARFLFETRFYEERAKGYVTAARLNQLMEEAQREAYGDALDEVHPHFWASKLHFYITSVPFYNFPYTFGYLFSLSIYARALEEGTSYEEKYLALLRDTAIMTVEDLAAKHLAEDVTTEAFWAKGIALCVQDVEQFLAMTK